MQLCTSKYLLANSPGGAEALGYNVTVFTNVNGRNTHPRRFQATKETSLTVGSGCILVVYWCITNCPRTYSSEYTFTVSPFLRDPLLRISPKAATKVSARALVSSEEGSAEQVCSSKCIPIVVRRIQAS